MNIPGFRRYALTIGAAALLAGCGGAQPLIVISDAKGTFYGTTIGGGTGCYHYGCQGGYGTVFRLTR